MKNKHTSIVKQTKIAMHYRDGRQQRSNLSYRELPVRTSSDGIPSTLDEEKRSVEVVGATEDPVMVMDFERYEPVMEVLLMDGCEMPKARQVPLLDTHRRWDGTGSVMGSFRDMETGNGQLTGRAFFSSAPESEGVWTKVREGHVTDFSVGYRVIESTWIPDGQKQTIKGRSYKGPLRVTTRWRVKEMSVCPIGADERAKARQENEEQPTKPKKEITPMNKKLRKILEARGLAADATDEAAWKFYNELFERGEILVDGSDPAQGRQAPATDPPDTAGQAEAERAEAARAERDRISEISAMARKFKFPEDRMRSDLIDTGISVDEARAKIMAHLETIMEDPQTPARQFEQGMQEQEKFRAAAEGAILIRSGMTGIDRSQLAPGAGELSGHTLIELARHSLRLSGQRENGHILDVVGRALTTSDFPYLLAAVANKSLDMGWDSAEETWQIWCGTGSVNDFKIHKSVRASEFSDLDEIPEGKEYEYGKRDEAQEQYQIATYGKLGAITRQTIINDDLNAITVNMMGMGEAAARKVGDLPYAVLTANSAMGDGTALFHSDHSNLVADGSGAAPSVTTLNAGELAMGTQKDILGKRRLNIPVRFLLAPMSLKGSSEVFFKSERLAFTGSTDAEKAPANPWSGDVITRVYEGRLDDDDAAAWYLAARKGKTVVVYFLGGIQRPYFETKAGWNVDGAEYKVRIDAGAKAMDYRGLYKNDGN